MLIIYNVKIYDLKLILAGGKSSFVKCPKSGTLRPYTPNNDMETFEQKLDRIEDAVKQIGGNIIMAGDFNSRAL